MKISQKKGGNFTLGKFAIEPNFCMNPLALFNLSCVLPNALYIRKTLFPSLLLNTNFTCKLRFSVKKKNHSKFEQ